MTTMDANAKHAVTDAIKLSQIKPLSSNIANNIKITVKYTYNSPAISSGGGGGGAGGCAGSSWGDCGGGTTSYPTSWPYYSDSTSGTSASVTDWGYSTNQLYTQANMMAACESAMYDGARFARDPQPQPGDVLSLPDGSTLFIDNNGNSRIEDKNAKVTYKSNNIRDFSPHICASDMIAKFVEHVGSLGVYRSEVMKLPLELFIHWLIIEAAERDKDDVPDDVVPVVKQISHIRKPKCIDCGRYIPKLHQRNNFMFCNPIHATRHIEKLEHIKDGKTKLQPRTRSQRRFDSSESKVSPKTVAAAN